MRGSPINWAFYCFPEPGWHSVKAKKFAHKEACSPIALFVYKRPEHTRRTVEALQKNALAGESDLIVFSDAPKSEVQAEKVREVRAYIRTIAGFRSVSIVERDKNWGLAASIIDGVTAVVNKYGRIIVLEDDMVTSTYFLKTSQ